MLNNQFWGKSPFKFGLLALAAIFAKDKKYELGQRPFSIALPFDAVDSLDAAFESFELDLLFFPTAAPLSFDLDL